MEGGEKGEEDTAFHCIGPQVIWALPPSLTFSQNPLSPSFSISPMIYSLCMEEGTTETVTAAALIPFYLQNKHPTGFDLWPCSKQF